MSKGCHERESNTPEDGALKRLLREWERAGIPVLFVRGAENSTRAGEDREIHLLVPQERAGDALSVLDSSLWLLKVGMRGPWRFTRGALYVIDGVGTVHINWGVPAAPMPAAALARLEHHLWEHARETECGWREPAPAGLALYCAVQLGRPGTGRVLWEEPLLGALERCEDRAALAALARRTGVAMTLRRAVTGLGLDIEQEGLQTLGSDGRGWVWRVSSALHRKLRSRSLRSLLVGTPLPGRTLTDCRFRGVELTLGPKVFVPKRVSEALVDRAVSWTEPGRPGVVLEAGTGCGVVALALAAARPELEIHAADTSPRALRWARRNQKRLGVGSVRWYRGSLLDPFPEDLLGRVDAILTNVPYVPACLRNPAWTDAPGAVEGVGLDGLDLQRSLAWQAMLFLKPGGRLALQLAGDQWDGFARELQSWGYDTGGIAAQSAADVVSWARLP